MKLSSEQRAAIDEINRWLKTARYGHNQIFRLFGYAGTGKTTLAKQIAETLDIDVLFAAFTGKAAQVMREKGCDDASTIHALIYRPDTRTTDTNDDDNPDDKTSPDAPRFVLNRQSKVKDADLIIIDECSMVDEQLGTDLMSFGTPLLILGDPAQLPPVSGAGYFTQDPPNVLLTQIHRQAAGNTIIKLAEDIRLGKPLMNITLPPNISNVRIITRHDLKTEDVLSADQVLVGTNRTRRAYNKRLRELKGFTSPTPEKGDKLVCLKNNHTKGLLNGSIWMVDATLHKRKNAQKIPLKLSSDDPSAKPTKVSVFPHFFEGNEDALPWALRKTGDEFDYGYALTVHKAQGSEWDNVIIFDESNAFRDNSQNWLYTAITRASKRVTIVI